MPDTYSAISSAIKKLSVILDHCHQIDQWSLGYRSEIPQCGQDALNLLVRDPGKAHELAEIKLRSLPKAHMASSPWSSLYAESVFQLVITYIKAAQLTVTEHMEKKPSILDASQSGTLKLSESPLIYLMLDEMLSKVTDVLDRAMLLTGLTPDLFQWTHKILEDLHEAAREADARYDASLWSEQSSNKVTVQWTTSDKLLTPANLPSTFGLQKMNTQPPIRFPVETLSLSGLDDLNEFTMHLGASHFNRNNRRGPLPVLILNGMESWTSLKLWQNPAFLLNLTLGGRRMVPIEVGKSYTDLEWTQRLISFREFVVRDMLPGGTLAANKRGYLAQHDLFRQIPKFKREISEPVFCYSDPPYPFFPDPKPVELVKSEQDLSDEVEKNIWMGPAHTVSPAHTDPYHNIFAQVVGYKYIRLYPPSQKANMYPRGSESGINMSNTSRIDVADAMRAYEGWIGWDKADEMGHYSIDSLREELDEQFPLLREAKYLETVIEPGQMLFLPKGWFHYVRSLTTSISVSFWWK